MVKRVLMIAYHFPPCRGSSGIQRTLKFSRFLPEHNWQPIVLAPNKGAYAMVGDDLMAEIHPNTIVARSWALDISRHLSIKGIYFNGLAIPDRWNSWVLSAVPKGLMLIKKYEPDLIWCTYPIASAHIIGLSLHSITKIPLIADFRDPMVYETWPIDTRIRKVHEIVERKIVRKCSRAVFTSPSSVKLYADRYPDLPDSKWEVISNGYDEENFREINGKNISNHKHSNAPLVLVHSGLMEQEDRDPTTFFQVLSEMVDQKSVSSENLKIILRATGHDEKYQTQITQYNLQGIVHLMPQIGYNEALAEMQAADGLLIFQGTTCNRQIPAKAYEYLRSYKPIFVMADKRGDTARLILDGGIHTISTIDNLEEMRNDFPKFLNSVRNNDAPIASTEYVQSFSRRALTGKLVSVFENVLKENHSQ